MPRARPRTRLQLIAQALEHTHRAQAVLATIELRSTRGDLRACLLGFAPPDDTGAQLLFWFRRRLRTPRPRSGLSMAVRVLGRVSSRAHTTAVRLLDRLLCRRDVLITDSDS